MQPVLAHATVGHGIVLGHGRLLLQTRLPRHRSLLLLHVQVEVRGNDVDPWVGHVQAAATCAYVINTRVVCFVNNVCSILRGHSSTLYRGLESKQALLRCIRLHWPDDYGHAEYVLDLDSTHDVVWSYEALLKRIEERKQTLINQEAMRDADRAQLTNGNEEALRNILRCKICLDFQSSVFFEPCQHVCTCGRCGAAMTHCPVRSQLIRDRKEILLS
ncbi:hypothetical protein RvY_19140 [Ramazzottius varieornatus]|uniref:RING-type domain-containing protein n=1 Tax=Ramazzottius varieornatus TaxID=947166 RepID=A0A1D1W8G7_RAMVA|nr:hypothetical protein RvY_19140 [Ramazzottius varieornatus]